MTDKNKEEKKELHPRNKHKHRYNFKDLISRTPELASHLKLTDYGDESIDFFNPESVKLLNKALLLFFYKINYWDIPTNYLCPPIPGRADYIHYLADVLGSINNDEIPKGEKIKCLEIGVGASCVYPIIGSQEYNWSFVGADIDMVSLKSANKIIELNPNLKNIECRQQPDASHFFTNIIQKNEYFDLTICNPPFYSSLDEVHESTLRKLSNLKGKRISKVELNFGGVSTELYYEGGELNFIKKMILESEKFKDSCLWFSTLVSNGKNLQSIYNVFNVVKTTFVKTIEMGQGNKVSRIVVWSYMTKEEQKKWISEKWL